jgi:uncharacterized membrane protein
MREWLLFLTEHAVTLIDLMALAIIAYGAAEAFLRAVPLVLSPIDAERRRLVWLRFARLLVAGLTFQLAADIIETAITDDWQSIGRIAAIAVVRTFLNYFRGSAPARNCQHRGIR